MIEYILEVAKLVNIHSFEVSWFGLWHLLKVNA